MIIYMLLNTVTDKVYIGRTHGTIENRIKGHWDHALKEGGTTFLSEAIRDYPDKELWDFIVLQHCYSEQQFCDAESAWIEICSARCANVGYNMHTSKNTSQSHPVKDRAYFSAVGKKGGEKSKAMGKSKTRAEMSEEEREKFREWGRKGARRSKEKMAEKPGIVLPNLQGLSLVHDQDGARVADPDLPLPP